MFRIKYIAATLAVCSIVPFSHANSIITNPGAGLVTTAINNTTAGFDFTVGSDSLMVTALGLWDQNRNGFTNSHTVGLWDNTGNLLAQVSISSGTSNPLTGDFRYVTLATPVTLNAGATYVLGATFRNGDLDRVISNSNGNQAAFDTAVVAGNYRQIVGLSSLAFPNSNIQPGSAVGPNAQFAPVTIPVAIPDAGPGILLLGLVLGALLLVHWQIVSASRNKKSAG